MRVACVHNERQEAARVQSKRALGIPFPVRGPSNGPRLISSEHMAKPKIAADVDPFIPLLPSYRFLFFP